MNPWVFLVLVVVVIVLALWIPRYRLRRAIAAPFPEEWVQFLERNLGVSWERETKANISVSLKDIVHDAIAKAVEAYREPDS